MVEIVSITPRICTKPIILVPNIARILQHRSPSDSLVDEQHVRRLNIWPTNLSTSVALWRPVRAPPDCTGSPQNPCHKCLFVPRTPSPPRILTRTDAIFTTRRDGASSGGPERSQPLWGVKSLTRLKRKLTSFVSPLHSSVRSISVPLPPSPLRGARLSARRACLQPSLEERATMAAILRREQSQHCAVESKASALVRATPTRRLPRPTAPVRLSSDHTQGTSSNARCS